MTTEVLAAGSVRVGAVAANQAEAIDQVGALLVETGLVTEAYVRAMHAREAIISTYLGNGIALPHGTDHVQDAILRTGLAVLQYPAGVPWGDEPARLVIGLAATSDEHLGIMSRLAAILDDAELCDRLCRSTDPAEIHAALTAEVPDEDVADDGLEANEPRPGTVRRTARITNPSGLHARPAAQVVARLQPLDADVTLEINGRRADARSITSTLGLGAAVGDELTITVDGPDAEAALDAVLGIVTSGSDL
ncbi:MAG TPA: HPr family phosphocarrier protein [Candidatus Limnocylindrales bacterium]